MKVHVLYEPEAEDRRLLEQNIKADITLSYGAITAGAASFDVLVAGRPTREDVSASSALATLVIPFAGLPEQTGRLLKDEHNLQIVNLHHNARPTAEMAITLMLAVMRMIVPADQGLRKGDWSIRYEPRTTRMAHGSRALVLGFGAVGKLVAELCDGLGMHVSVVSRSPQVPCPDTFQHSGVSRLDEALAECDVLLVCLPLTIQSEGMIDTERLALLSESAIVVNVGRGGIIDEGALYHALVGNEIFGAGLDVWYQYPEEEAKRKNTYPAHFPFHELKNVVMSPHMAGGVAGMERSRMVALADVLNQLHIGKVSKDNVVDIKLGY